MLVTGSFDGNVYFLSFRWNARTGFVKTGWYINQIYEFKDGTIAASSADGFVYFMTKDGRLVRRATEISDLVTDSRPNFFKVMLWSSALPADVILNLYSL